MFADNSKDLKEMKGTQEETEKVIIRHLHENIVLKIRLKTQKESQKFRKNKIKEITMYSSLYESEQK